MIDFLEAYILFIILEYYHLINLTSIFHIIRTLLSFYCDRKKFKYESIINFYISSSYHLIWSTSRIIPAIDYTLSMFN